MARLTSKEKRKAETLVKGIAKCPTGIKGLDDILQGGLPRGRCTLVCGGPGCGKTVLGVEFIYRGITEFNEPGVFVTFEESGEKLTQNFTGFGIDLSKLTKDGSLEIANVHLTKHDYVEVGEFSLDGLIARLDHALKKVKAKRVTLDTIETLFGSFSNESRLRLELKRLFNWLDTQGVTTVITGEKGASTLTRQNLEEYLTDCVIALDHRVSGQVSTRRLRIVKYRGSEHATDEFPFLINRWGFAVLPVTSLSLDHKASMEVVSTGIPGLDKMFGIGGIYRGSSVLISGTAGTGKTTAAASFVDAACRRGERCIYFAFEESREQLIRNMHSVGLKLEQWVGKDLLRYEAVRPTVNGLEAHLFKMERIIEDFKPHNVVVDPITNFLSVGTHSDVKLMLLRLIDFLKSRQITTFLTSLTDGGAPTEQTDIGVSSLVDTWLLLRDNEYNGERNRVLYVLKSRGASHSNQVREFVITSHGVDLIDVYIGRDGVLIGSARVAKQEAERQRSKKRTSVVKRREEILAGKLKALEAQISLLRATYDTEVRNLMNSQDEEETYNNAGRNAEMEYRRSALPHN